MVDSNSLIEPGLTSGNLQFLGSYDECIRLQVPESAKFVMPGDGSQRSIKATHAVQYCTVNFPISMVLSPTEVSLQIIDMTSYCVISPIVQKTINL